MIRKLTKLCRFKEIILEKLKGLLLAGEEIYETRLESEKHSPIF